MRSELSQQAMSRMEKMDNVIFVKVTRPGGQELIIERYQATSVITQIGSPLQILDSDGQAHSIPSELWECIEIRRQPMPDVLEVVQL
jgi:hypothetical protein